MVDLDGRVKQTHPPRSEGNESGYNPNALCCSGVGTVGSCPVDLNNRVIIRDMIKDIPLQWCV